MMPATGVCAPGADVGRGARDGAGRRQPAEQRRGDVGDALRDQLDVRVVPVAAHPVGDHRRHQRLDRAEHRDREGRRRAAPRISVGPERRDLRRAAGPPGCRRSACRWSRPAAAAARTAAVPTHEREDRRRARAATHARSPAMIAQRRRRASAVAAGDHVPAVRRERVACRGRNSPGHRVDLQAEEVLDLRAGDQHRDAVGEADDDRARDELHRRCRCR